MCGQQKHILLGARVSWESGQWQGGRGASVCSAALLAGIGALMNEVTCPNEAPQCIHQCSGDNIDTDFLESLR